MVPDRPSSHVFVRALLLAVVVSLAPPLAAQDRRETVRIFARLDREIVTELEVARYMSRRVPRSTEGIHPAAEAALVEIVLLKLETREARARGVEVSPGMVDAALEARIRRHGGSERFEAMLAASPTTIEDIRKGLEDLLLVRRLYTRTATGPTTPGRAPLRGRIRPREVREHFRAHRDRYLRPARVRVGLIEIRPRDGETEGGLDRAREVLEKLGGGGDFTALARAESRGPKASEGGDLGWIEEGRLDPRVDAFVFEAKAGTVSEPIRTARGGWWIVRVVETEPARPLPFEVVADRIADELRSDRLTRLRRVVLARLAAEAVIEPDGLREKVRIAIQTIGEPIRP